VRSWACCASHAAEVQCQTHFFPKERCSMASLPVSAEVLHSRALRARGVLAAMLCLCTSLAQAAEASDSGDSSSASGHAASTPPGQYDRLTLRPATGAGSVSANSSSGSSGAANASSGQYQRLTLRPATGSSSVPSSGSSTSSAAASNPSSGQYQRLTLRPLYDAPPRTAGYQQAPTRSPYGPPPRATNYQQAGGGQPQYDNAPPPGRGTGRSMPQTRGPGASACDAARP